MDKAQPIRVYFGLQRRVTAKVNHGKKYVIKKQADIDWRLTTEDARIKLKQLYPIM